MYNGQATIDALTFLKGMYDDGCAYLFTEGYPNPEFAARRAIFTDGSSSGIPYYVSDMADIGSTDEWGVTAIPHTTPDPVMNIYGGDIMIPATTPEIQLAAWIVVKWFTSPEMQAEWDKVSGYFPTRASTAELLTDYVDENPQWGQALALLPYGTYEPQLISYQAVRDAAQQAFNEILQGADIKATLAVMSGKPVTIRLLDPPLHEFVPRRPEDQQRLADSLGITVEEIRARADALHETNPMMGHRGVRLGVTYPEISEMQIRAILEAAAELRKEGKKPLPEIMIPVTCDVREVASQAEIVKRVHDEVAAKYGVRRIPHLVGTMIEIPRAALRAGEIAEVAEFFSFGTNDLTQMTFGFSRDDIGNFVPDYIEKRILPADPFNILDQDGVGELVALGIQRGRATRPKLKVGICGEHGGEPSSVKFCHRVGMDYVSCSPFRVPIARLAAAQAVAEEEPAAKPAKRKATRKKATRKKTAARRKK